MHSQKNSMYKSIKYTRLYLGVSGIVMRGCACDVAACDTDSGIGME